MRRPSPPIPWSHLLAELKALGLSYREQARRLNIRVTTLHRWVQGAEPRYQDGVRILRLHGAEILSARFSNPAVFAEVLEPELNPGPEPELR